MEEEGTRDEVQGEKVEAKFLYYLAKDMNLEMSNLYGEDHAVEVYNGVGPSWMPDELRKALDRLSAALLPAVLIHDMDYAYGDGTVLDFQLANRRLLANGLKCADYQYKWWHPMRYIVRHQAHAYARLCDAFGFPTYAAAVKETNQQVKRV